VGIPKGSIHKLVLITVNSERDPARRIANGDKIPDKFEFIDALTFGAGSRASTETREYLAEVTRKWQLEVRDGNVGGSDAFTSDAEIYVGQVNRETRESRKSAQCCRCLLRSPSANLKSPA